jgi:hypothetical protein
MSLLRMEGFEKYSSLNDVKGYLDYETFQTPTIISSSDGVATPRDSLSSIKMLSTLTDGGFSHEGHNGAGNLGLMRAILHYPKFAIKNLTSHTNGIVGFAYYAHTPAGGSYSPTTPIAAICDSNGKPHFFICVNGSMQIEIRRWNTSASLGVSNTTTASTYAWNSPVASTIFAIYNQYCSQDTVYNHHLSTPSTVGASCLTKNVSTRLAGINTSAFPLILTANSGNVLEINAWNYIEVEYNLSSSSTGGIKVRVNRNSSSNVIDATISDVQTTSQPTNSVQQIAFGTFWAHTTTGSAFGANWPTYFDDIYILNKDATAPNDFLGSVSCRKGNFDTQVSNSAPEGNLASINDAVFSGSANLVDKLKLSADPQQISVRSANLGVPDENAIKVVQPVIYGYNTIDGVPLNFKTSLNGTESSNYELFLSNNSVAGGVTYGPVLVSNPQGNEWTGSNLKSTEFKYGA